MRQAGVLHDVGDAGAVVATASDGARGRIDDALVREFLGTGGGSLHMMLIIHHRDLERKRGFPAALEPCETLLSIAVLSLIFLDAPTPGSEPVQDCLQRPVLTMEAAQGR